MGALCLFFYLNDAIVSIYADLPRSFKIRSMEVLFMKNNRASAIFYEMQKSHGFGFADGYGQIPLKSCKRFCNFFSAKGDEFVVGIDEKCFNQKIILIYFSTEGNEESLIGVIHLGDGNDPIEFFKSLIPHCLQK